MDTKDTLRLHDVCFCHKSMPAILLCSHAPHHHTLFVPTAPLPSCIVVLGFRWNSSPYCTRLFARMVVVAVPYMSAFKPRVLVSECLSVRLSQILQGVGHLLTLPQYPLLHRTTISCLLACSSKNDIHTFHAIDKKCLAHK
jgi:hypothetical protein